MSRLQSVSINSGLFGSEQVRYNIRVRRAAADCSRAAAVNNLRAPEVCSIPGVCVAHREFTMGATIASVFRHPPTHLWRKGLRSLEKLTLLCKGHAVAFPLALLLPGTLVMCPRREFPAPLGGCWMFQHPWLTPRDCQDSGFRPGRGRVRPSPWCLRALCLAAPRSYPQRNC